MATSLDKRIIGELELLAGETQLPEGKDDLLRFAVSMPGVGVRIRRGPNGVRAAWVVQYRERDGSKRQRRQAIGDAARLRAETAYERARDVFAKARLGGSPADDLSEARRKGRFKLGAMVAEFLEHKRAYVRPKLGEPVRASTYEATRRHLEQSWHPLHGMPLARITRENISDRLDAIKRDHGRDAKGHRYGGPTAARAALFALSELYVWAMGKGRVDHNPAIGVTRPSGGAARARVMDDRELAEIWRACEAGDHGAICRLLLLTGARRDEIGSLRSAEIGQDGTLHVAGQRTKNHRDLVLPLPPLALETIPSRPGREYVFGQRDGIGFSAWSASKRALDAKLGDKLKPWRLHDLRRSFASGLARLGVDLPTIEQCLNHRSGSFAGVVSVYLVHDYIPEKRRALALWADHVRTIVEDTERKALRA